MRDLKKQIEELQSQLKKHQRSSLKELPTRTIFIDPLLESLGWDVRDPDEVELEYPTVDSKSVDYALKVNRRAIALVEAKALNDPLDDVKAITQVVGYAANDGVEWCILTNGIKYRIYSSSQMATAPNKLLYEVSINPENEADQSTEQIAAQLSRLSRDSMARGVLDQLGEEIFTTAKVRKVLDKLFVDQADALVRLVRKTISDSSVTPAQIRSALSRIWHGESSETSSRTTTTSRHISSTKVTKTSKAQPEYDETHHTSEKPLEVVELYRALDRMCQDLAPGMITRKYLAKYVAWSQDKVVFCTAHLLQSGLRVWLKIDPSEISTTTKFARDVSHVGHWGLGDVELAIDNHETLRNTEQLIRGSYNAETRKKQRL